jgi:hypothetical protein
MTLASAASGVPLVWGTAARYRIMGGNKPRVGVAGSLVGDVRGAVPVGLLRGG